MKTNKNMLPFSDQRECMNEKTKQDLYCTAVLEYTCILMGAKPI